ncbi:MAG TPA: tRNA pseudouridine(55) synthase TruB [Myxococcaceae bacterium]|jgi:tRNA pseudouridine55 synthase
MNGVLVIDKPAGPTSFEVVQRVRSLLQVKKAGHTGTLDPMATGVLPVCLGEATKVAGLLTEGDKAYDAVVRLGVETDTQDAQGKVLAERPVPHLDRDALEAALQRFRGTFTQVPPMFSAVKVGGKRLHELARAGEEIPREGREVTVRELLLRDFSATELTLSVRSSKGFFVRTLAHDLGQSLGCGACLKALRRTASGPFVLARAVPLDRLDPKQAPSLVVPTAEALSFLPALTVSAADEVRVGHGVPLEVPPGMEGRVRVLSRSGALLALAEVGQDRRLRYLRVLA